jgi:hypothetical protein
MNSKLIGLVFSVALAAACLALALGLGPATYYDAEGAPPATRQADTQTPAPTDASLAKDKQASPLLQAQD